MGLLCLTKVSFTLILKLILRLPEVRTDPAVAIPLHFASCYLQQTLGEEPICEAAIMVCCLKTQSVNSGIAKIALFSESAPLAAV
jgi:hypothetical protein